ncbi:beta-ketoacyl-[acyl-carrier-protein] synthase family protein [Streptomyces armeniacus]|uniref:Beta-ketoacyl-[acyl-carrier-protein] synthase family protein n=1 Tax=Streptomyces armeniacus TaxID=83291 RepID=A0A345XT98_9ACTN|nr:beta-ketoacyl-[acyl-carrier-protein] synthase family protein [Streptomyces armeniacus]AXK34864.1 beta-ketoacyl-[acyl-carrier-protein] synthase family protein [Streptomyces armeniacus]
MGGTGERRRVVVTGLGIVSALGTGAGEFWSAACEGRVGTGPVTLFDTADCLTHHGGEIRDWTPPWPDDSYGHGPLTRSESFALAATRLALADGGLADPGPDAGGRLAGPYEPERVGAAFGIVVGNRPGLEPAMRAAYADTAGAETAYAEPVGAEPTGAEAGAPSRPGAPPSPLPPALPSQPYNPSRISALPAVSFRLHGPHLLLPTACAAGNEAVAQAADAIAEGRADAMLAGGSDELSEAMFLMFTSFRALSPDVVRPFDAHRAGLLLGEGAGVLLLESEEGARARGAPALAVVAGHGNVSDAYHMTAPHPEGRGAVLSMRAALRGAGLGPDGIDLVSAHGTGTPANDRAESRALAEVFGEGTRSAEPLPVTALKSLLGHAQGAAGAIAAAACVLALRDGVAPPTANVTAPDPNCLTGGLELVRDKPRHLPLRAAMNNAFGFGGNNCCVVFTRADAGAGEGT